MSNVFISYAHDDDPERRLCEQIEESLRNNRHMVWFDRDIPGGEKWWPEIKRKIIWCDVFVCLLSPNWLRSEYCQREFDIALYKGKAIVPIRIKKMSAEEVGKLHENIKQVQHILAETAIKDGFTVEILHRLKEAVARETMSAVFPPSIVIHPPDLEWCDIPKGTVTIIFDDRDEASYPVPAFRISKYPITNAQYQTFAHNGYRYRRFWHYSDNAYRWRLDHPKVGIIGEENKPYVNVSWYDAVAFCDWLSRQYEMAIELPSEMQWQRAAQGDDNRAYPWGKKFDPERCNTLESGIGRPTSVTRYKTGVSPYGVYDMAGNVWEWCKSAFDTPRYMNTHDSKPRTLRGGSWRDTSDAARVTSRISQLEGYQSERVGFRMVVRH